jgi:hypothetical protein
MFGRLYLQKMKSWILEVFALIINEVVIIESARYVEKEISSTRVFYRESEETSAQAYDVKNCGLAPYSLTNSGRVYALRRRRISCFAVQTLRPFSSMQVVGEEQRRVSGAEAEGSLQMG